jgi:hypothetical protein
MIQDRVSESLVLDYKGSPALSRDGKAPLELAKDVAALANSDVARIAEMLGFDKTL